MKRCVVGWDNSKQDRAAEPSAAADGERAAHCSAVVPGGKSQYKRLYRSLYYAYEVALDANLRDLRQRLLGGAFTPRRRRGYTFRRYRDFIAHSRC